MDRLKMQTQDVADGNAQKIAALWPHCVTETARKITMPDGSVRYESRLAVDFDKLRAELSKDVLDDGEERYQFTWPDKRASSRLANTPSDMALRPCREESAGKDGTPGGFDSENLYIEGDNLEVLKLLREDYLGKVKMIYIDPPYNTGNDFVYKDDFAQSKGGFEAKSGVFDEDGNQIVGRMERNTEANGRFHTDWLNMIYPRLKVARDLLAEDGVIFISIDDNEAKNLRNVCDEVFGGQNFVAQLVWQRAYSPKNDAKYVSNSHDYILVYAKQVEDFTIGRLERTEEANARYSNPDNDPRGVWKSSDMSVKTYTASCDYPITTPSGKVVEPPAGRCWSLSRNAFRERLQDNRIWFGPDGSSVPSIKRFLSELKFEGMAPTSILFYKEVGHSQEGAQEVVKLFGDKGVFDGPKPVRLMLRLLTLANLDDDDLVLDFFSGSASMAHAVMQMNATKGSHCRFIMVQIPEAVSDTKKNQGYTNICEIGKERIRRAGKKVKEEAGQQGQDLDIGFRVLKLNTSNMEDVFYTPEEFTRQMMLKTVDNVKPGRTPLDLLFQVMPELNIELSAKIEEKEVNGKKVFFVDDTYLIATFDTEVNESAVTEIARMKPQYFVMRDASTANDNVLDNFEQIFRHYSPDTVRKIL